MKTTYPYIKFYLKRTVDNPKYGFSRETVGVYSTEQEASVKADIENDPLFYRWINSTDHNLILCSADIQ
jgi:glutaredoxin-related protein